MINVRLNSHCHSGVCSVPPFWYFLPSDGKFSAQFYVKSTDFTNATQYSQWLPFANWSTFPFNSVPLPRQWDRGTEEQAVLWTKPYRLNAAWWFNVPMTKFQPSGSHSMIDKMDRYVMNKALPVLTVPITYWEARTRPGSLEKRNTLLLKLKMFWLFCFGFFNPTFGSSVIGMWIALMSFSLVMSFVM